MHRKDTLCIHFIRSAINESHKPHLGISRFIFFFDLTADSMKLKCDGEVTGSVVMMLICARASSLHTRGLILTALGELFFKFSKRKLTSLC